MIKMTSYWICRYDEREKKYIQNLKGKFLKSSHFDDQEDDINADLGTVGDEDRVKTGIVISARV